MKTRKSRKSIKTRKTRIRKKLKGGSSPSTPILKEKIQYVYISAHGHISNPETKLAFNNPTKLIKDLDRRILVNAYCSNFAPTYNTENKYLEYLLNVHAKESLDVLWNVGTKEQQNHFKEIHKILTGISIKKDGFPITHLSRTVVHKYYFNYDENIQYDNISFGIYLFTDNNKFKDITKDIYEHINKDKKIRKKHFKKSSLELGTSLLSPKSYGYEYEDKSKRDILGIEDKRSITLTSKQIIKYFKDNGVIVRLISNSCRGTPMKSKMYEELEKKWCGWKIAQNPTKNAGPTWVGNSKSLRTLSGATSKELKKYIEEYVPQDMVKYIIENITNNEIYRITHSICLKIKELKEEVKSKSDIEPLNQHYFTDKFDYNSELVLDNNSTITTVLAKKYGYFDINNRLSKPIHLYLVDHKTYSKPDFKYSMKRPLYPNINFTIS